MRENDLKSCISTIKEYRDKLIQGLRDGANEKGENPTDEELSMEPFIVLYDQISKCSMNILSLPTIEKAYNMLDDKLTDEEMTTFLNMLVLSMVHSAHSALIFYDEYMENTFSNQFKDIIEKINVHGSIIDGHNDVIKVYRNKVDALEHEIKMLKIKLDMEK